MNVQCSLIPKLFLHVFKVGLNTAELTKNICFVKYEGKIDLSSVIRWLKKFCSVCKNPNDQGRSGRPKAGFWGHAQCYRGKLGEYQVSLASHDPVLFVTFITPAKGFRAVCLVPHMTKRAKLDLHKSCVLYIFLLLFLLLLFWMIFIWSVPYLLYWTTEIYINKVTLGKIQNSLLSMLILHSLCLI